MSFVPNEISILSTLREMISIPSVNPSLVPGGAGEREIALYIVDRLKALGLETRLEGYLPGRPNALGIWKGRGNGSSLILCGHTDTVGVDGMDIDPYAATYEEGRVYGRGAVDMKGGLASILGAVEALVEGGFEPGGDLIVAAVADEEYASKGAEHLADHYKADAAIVAETSDLDIVIAHKGFAWFTVEVLGKRAHGSDYEKGVDAITLSAPVLQAFEGLGQQLVEKQHPLVGPPSLHASMIEGGREISTYPDRCTIKFERRTIPGETRAQVEAEMHGVLNRLRREKGMRMEADLFFFRNALEVSPQEPIIGALQAALKQHGRSSRLLGQAAWMDTAVLTQAGIPSILFGPGGDGLHSSVEWVDFQHVVEASRVLAATVASFCRAV